MFYDPMLVRFWLVLVVVGGCVDSQLVPCGELDCPVGDVCTAGGCAAPADVAACAGMLPGDPCKTFNGATGTCAYGACHTDLCGNGQLDPGEACDGALGLDPMLVETCSPDCKTIYRCGNGVVDPGEQCDDGNHNPADGCDACVLTSWHVDVIVGMETSALATSLANPSAVAFDGQGRVFVADTDNHRVLRVELDGSVTTIAGTGQSGFAGDGGAATSALFAYPQGVAVDGLGRVFVADTNNNRVRRVEIDGTITTIAGTGVVGYAGDGGPAILAQLSGPFALAVDGLGNVYVADTGNNVIRRIDDGGMIVTIAGTGAAGYGGDGGAATAALLTNPAGVAIDAVGRLAIADSGNSVVRNIDTAGTISTIAGNGAAGFAGDGGPAIAAQLSFPSSVAIDPQGRVAIADFFNQRVRRIELDGTIVTIAGNGVPTFGGDGGTATAAALQNPLGIAIAGDGTLVIADTSNQRVRAIAAAGTISTIAGDGAFGVGGDGGMATSAQLQNPFGITIDAQGRIFVADTFDQRIRRVDVDGTITTVAGAGTQGIAGDGGPAIVAQLNRPSYVAIDSLGRAIITDTYNSLIRRVEVDGTITRLAGIPGNPGYTGDGGPSTSARVQNPNGVAIDGLGRIVFADTYNLAIRRIEADGTIVTIAGTGAFGSGGDGGPATAAQLGYPYGVAVDGQGRVLIGDTSNQRVRRIELDGTIHTIAGTGIAGFGGDGGPATAAQLSSPYGVITDALGRVYVADAANQRVRRIELDGTITTIIGMGALGGDGDGGPAAAAQLDYPYGVAIDPQGRLVVADTNNGRIRRVELDGSITTVAGKIDPDGVGAIAAARLVDPRAIVIAPTVTLVAGGSSGTLEAIANGAVAVVGGRYPQSTATGALARFRTIAFGSIGGVAIDSAQHLIYVTETSANRLHVIAQVAPADPSSWTIAPLANAAGTAGFADGDAMSAQLRAPTGLYLDTTAHVLYIADTGNHAIRALDLATGSISTIVNASHALGFAGDGGPAAAALLYQPTAVTRCANGDVFVADTGNNRVRRVDASGLISTVLGDGVPASSGEGAPARTFPVDAPHGLACDPFGNVLVTSSTAVRLVTASDAHIVDGSGAVHTIYGAPPRNAFPASVTSCLTGLAAPDAATVAITDACTGLLVQLARVRAM